MSTFSLCGVSITLLACLFVISAQTISRMVIQSVHFYYLRHGDDFGQFLLSSENSTVFKVVEGVDYRFLSPCNFTVVNMQNYSDPAFADCIERFLDPRNPSNQGSLVFIEDKTCGIGNMHRALASAFLVSLVTNRTFYVHRSSYYEYFDPIIPTAVRPFNYALLPYLSKTPTFHRFNTENYWKNPALYGQNLVELWSENKVVVFNTITDMSLLTFANPTHQDFLRSLGILTTLSTKEMHFEVMRFAYSILFHYTSDIRSQVDSWSPQFHKHRIGLQLRYGGHLANTVESTKYLDKEDTAAFIQGVSAYLQSHEIALNETTLFVSTDSSYGLHAIQKHFPNHVFVPPDHLIGHSSEMGMKFRSWAYRSAMIDIALLQDCEYIILTKGSSFSVPMALKQKVWNVAIVHHHMKNHTAIPLSPSMLL